MINKISVAVFGLFFCVLAQAEILQGVTYFSSLGDIRTMYPNATFRSVKPAWLQPSQAYYTITGSGMPGTLHIVFNDSRPAIRKELADNASDPNFDANGSLKALANEPENDALNVSWVRWVPEAPIPVERYKQRYGNPVCSFDTAMRPICTWETNALEAQMSDDQKKVEFVTSAYTKAERRSGFSKKFGFIPEDLK